MHALNIQWWFAPCNQPVAFFPDALTTICQNTSLSPSWSVRRPFLRSFPYIVTNIFGNYDFSWILDQFSVYFPDVFVILRVLPVIETFPDTFHRLTL